METAITPERHPGTELLLDAEAIEKALSVLWKDSYRVPRNGSTLHKIALSNLVVITTEQDRTIAEKIINRYASTKPSRVITIILSTDKNSAEHAHVSASCSLTAGMQAHLCWEQITIEAPQSRMKQIIGLTRSLLTGGNIPVIMLDLYGLKRRIDYRGKLFRMANMVFVDGHEQFRNLLPPPGILTEQIVYGLEWIKINSMREAIRQFFDVPDHITLLKRLTDVVICYRFGGEGVSSSVHLLAGWIQSSLGLVPDVAARDRIVSVAPHDRKVTIQLDSEKGEETRILAVTFKFEGEETELVFETEDGGILCTWRGEKHRHPRPKPFTEADFVVEQSGKDKVRSSYSASYRSAVASYNLSHSMIARRGMIIVNDPDQLPRITGRLFYRLALRALIARGKFTVALAGGTTPKRIYQELVRSPYAPAVDWNDVLFFFGDERPVGPDDPQSNFKLANDHLLQPLGISEKNVFRIEGENPRRKEEAKRYQREIEKHVPTSPEGIPRFDLIFLGVGEDGHTASLFPENIDNGAANHNLVAATYAPRLGQPRTSFTFSLINNAANIFVVITGEGKKNVMRRIFFPEDNAIVPAARINPSSGRLLWIVDREAASELAGTELPFEVSQW
jgi:6-phosphogluconolactonase